MYVTTATGSINKFDDIFSHVWIQSTNVTDGQTGRQTDGHRATAKTALMHGVATISSRRKQRRLLQTDADDEKRIWRETGRRSLKHRQRINSTTTRPICAKCVGKLAHGSRKIPLDFDGNPDPGTLADFFATILCYVLVRCIILASRRNMLMY